MIKFFGKPLEAIKSQATGKIIFTFDTKGEFVTDDEVIIRRASGNFDSIEVIVDEVETKKSKIVKKTAPVAPPIKVEHKTKKEIEAAVKEADDKKEEIKASKKK